MSKITSSLFAEVRAAIVGSDPERAIKEILARAFPDPETERRIPSSDRFGSFESLSPNPPPKSHYGHLQVHFMQPPDPEEA